MFKDLGIMVLLNQMESFLLRLNDEEWTHKNLENSSISNRKKTFIVF